MKLQFGSMCASLLVVTGCLDEPRDGKTDVTALREVATDGTVPDVAIEVGPDVAPEVAPEVAVDVAVEPEEVVEPEDVVERDPEVANDVSVEVDVALEVDSVDAADADVVRPDLHHPTQDAGLTLVVGADGVPAQTVVPLRVDVAAGVAAPSSVVWWAYFPHVPDPVRIGEGITFDFTANFVGEYEIVAEVMGGDGVLVRLSNHLLIIAGAGLHVELSWHTPGDDNETDTSDQFDIFSAGSDVDLHFLHEEARGVFFGPLLDCHFANPNPEWYITGPVDNPRLDRDDTDSFGPEILRLDVYEPGKTYTVGVHYYDDWDYGSAWAAVRIFVDGVLADEWANVELQRDDMWTSHRIVDGVAARQGTVPDITPNYLHGTSPTPPRDR